MNFSLSVLKSTGLDCSGAFLANIFNKKRSEQNMTRHTARNIKKREAEKEALELEKQKQKAEREAKRAEKKQKERAEIIRDIDDMISIGSPPEWHEELPDEKAQGKISISKEQFEKLCAMFCTGEEIAGWFYCSPRSVDRWCWETYGQSFSDIYAKLSMRGNISLRRLMLHHAARNAVMSIFLAKNYLGMKDNPDDSSQAEIIAHLDEIKGALLEAARNPVIDADTGMVYDANYAEVHAEDTASVGKAIEVEEDAD